MVVAHLAGAAAVAAGREELYDMGRGRPESGERPGDPPSGEATGDDMPAPHNQGAVVGL